MILQRLLASIYRRTQQLERHEKNMAKEITWPQKIRGLKKLLSSVGRLWPKPSTMLSGYAEGGPYHCGDCEYLKGLEEGQTFVDENGKGRCTMTVVMVDTEAKKDEKGRPIVDIQKGCCEFVEPLKKKEALVQIQK